MKSVGSLAWVGDLLAWDTQENKWAIINRDNIGTLSSDNSSCECGFDMDRYIPDAICVIPACHTDNNKAHWVALADTNDETYRLGTTTAYESDNVFGKLTYSSTNTCVPSLIFYNCAPMVYSDTTNNKHDTAVSGSWIFLKDSWSVLQAEFGDIDCLNIQNLQNNSRKDPKYYKDIDGSDIKIDIPVNTAVIAPWLYGDGTYDANNSIGNLKYKGAFQSFYNNDEQYRNILTDLDGYGNTHKVLNYSKSHPAEKFEAVWAAFNYTLTNYSNGDWYLPSSGEFAYLYARWYTIQLSLYKLYKITNKPTTWPRIFPFAIRGYWSSTLTDDSNDCGGDNSDASLSYGVPINYKSYNGLCVRSFKIY